MNLIKYQQQSQWTIVPTLTVRPFNNCVHIGIEWFNFYFGLSFDRQSKLSDTGKGKSNASKGEP